VELLESTRLRVGRYSDCVLEERRWRNARYAAQKRKIITYDRV